MKISKGALFRVVVTFIFSCFLSSCINRDGALNKNIEPVASWRFDNVDDGRINDCWGKHDGQLKGVMPKQLLQKGITGQALHFNDGSNYIVVPHSPALSLTDQFTIECVVMPYDIKGYNTIIWKGDRTVSPQEINYYVDIKDGEVELKGKKKDGNWFVYATSQPVVKPNKWYNIIITWNKGDIAIYVNGRAYAVKAKEQKIDNGRFVANNKPLMIGCGKNPRGVAGYPFNGLIDEIKIFRQTDFVTNEYLAAKEQKRIEHQRMDLRQKLVTLSERLKTVSEELTADESDMVLVGSDSENKAAKDLDALTNDTNKLTKQVNTSLDALENNLNFKAFYQKYSKADCPFILSVLPTSKRLVKKLGFFNDISPETKSAAVSLARNEYDGFQVIAIGNPYDAVKQVKVDIGTFTHENGKDRLANNAITFGWIKSIKTEKPDIPVDFSGDIPDVIMDGESQFDIAKADFTPIFFRIYADTNTQPGTYRGTISFCQGNSVSTVNVSIKVYNFALPKTTSLKIAFSFFNSFYKKWYGYKNLSDKQQDYINQYLLNYRITPNNIYSNAQVTPTINTMNKFKSEGANFCTLKYYGSSRVLSEEELNETVAGYRDIITKLKQNDLYQYAYFYSYDELESNKKKLPAAQQFLTAMRQAYPDLKCLETSVPHDDIAPLFNNWCPLIDFFSLPKAMALINKARARGDEIWWYVADDPAKPFPNLFLDYPVFDSRILMTMSYMYNVKGVLYWCINREWSTNMTEGAKWPAIPWKSYIININSKKRVFKNGMGNYVYPGPDGKIYPSLRLENLRDGIEDYEYLALLKKLIGKAKKQNSNCSLVKDAERLLIVPTSVATAVNNYSSNPKYLLDYRKQVAEMIEKLLEVDFSK